MTSGHFIFIPAVLVVGIFVGFMLGSRVAQDRLNLERKKEAERAAARAARAARTQGAKSPSDEEPSA